MCNFQTSGQALFTGFSPNVKTGISRWAKYTIFNAITTFWKWRICRVFSLDISTNATIVIFPGRLTGCKGFGLTRKDRSLSLATNLFVTPWSIRPASHPFQFNTAHRPARYLTHMAVVEYLRHTQSMFLALNCTNLIQSMLSTFIAGVNVWNNTKKIMFHVNGMEVESWNSWEMLRWPPAQSKRKLKNTALSFDVWYRSKTMGASTKHILAFWRSSVGKTHLENLDRVPCGRCWSQNSTL